MKRTNLLDEHNLGLTSAKRKKKCMRVLPLYGFVSLRLVEIQCNLYQRYNQKKNKNEFIKKRSDLIEKKERDQQRNYMVGVDFLLSLT